MIVIFVHRARPREGVWMNTYVGVRRGRPKHGRQGVRPSSYHESPQGRHGAQVGRSGVVVAQEGETAPCRARWQAAAGGGASGGGDPEARYL